MGYKIKNLSSERFRSMLVAGAQNDKRVLFVPVVGDCQILYVKSGEVHDLQYLVDGPFETASMTNGVTIWMCENAKLFGLNVGRYPVNFRATRIALALRPNWGTAIVGDIFISGTVVNGFRSITDKNIVEVRRACAVGDLGLLRGVDPGYESLLRVKEEYSEWVMDGNVIGEESWWRM